MKVATNQLLIAVRDIALFAVTVIKQAMASILLLKG
jgi:hypothetical protein